MGIRFYIPLPGPFAWVPGKKHPKPQPAGPTLTDRIAESNETNLHGVAHYYAEASDYPHPDLFADTVVQRHRFERNMWGFAGVLAGLVAYALIAGPGIILIGLIPVIGWLVLVPAAIPGVIAALVAARTERVIRLVSDDFGITATHRA